jgi:hypothetical protein
MFSKAYPRMPTLLGTLGVLGILDRAAGTSPFSFARFGPVLPIENLGITGITGGALAKLEGSFLGRQRDMQKRTPA